MELSVNNVIMGKKCCVVIESSASAKDNNMQYSSKMTENETKSYLNSDGSVTEKDVVPMLPAVATKTEDDNDDTASNIDNTEIFDNTDNDNVNDLIKMGLSGNQLQPCEKNINPIIDSYIHPANIPRPLRMLNCWYLIQGDNLIDVSSGEQHSTSKPPTAQQFDMCVYGEMCHHTEALALAFALTKENRIGVIRILNVVDLRKGTVDSAVNEVIKTFPDNSVSVFYSPDFSSIDIVFKYSEGIEIESMEFTDNHNFRIKMLSAGDFWKTRAYLYSIKYCSLVECAGVNKAIEVLSICKHSDEIRDSNEAQLTTEGSSISEITVSDVTEDKAGVEEYDFSYLLTPGEPDAINVVKETEPPDSAESNVVTETSSVNGEIVTSEKSSDTVQIEETTLVQIDAVIDNVPIDTENSFSEIPDMDSQIDPNIPILTEADLIPKDDRTPEEILRECGFIDPDSVPEKVYTEVTSSSSIVSRLTDDLPTSHYEWLSLEGMVHENTFVPEALKNIKIWICRCGKKPWSPNGNYSISPTDVNECVTYDEAIVAAEKYGYDGVSIMLMESNDICCVDIDHCIEDGKVNPLAWTIAKKINSYTEISTSGSGLHIFLYASNHLDWNQMKKDALGKGIHLEIYFCKKHICFCGHTIKGFEQLRRADKELEEIYNAYMAPKYKQYDDAAASEPPPTCTADELMQLLKKDRAGAPHVLALTTGDTSGFENQNRSSVLWSILCKMCFYCVQPNVIKELLMSSQLDKTKWMTMRGNEPYIDYEIRKALMAVKQHYHPSRKKATVAQQKKPLSLQAYEDDFSFDFQTLANVELNAIALSEFFGKTIKDVVCYSAVDKSFFIYNGIIWDASQQETVMAGMAKRFIKHCLSLCSLKIKTLENELKSGNDNDEKNAEKKAELEKAYALHNYYKSQSSFGARGKLIADVKNEIAVDHEQFDRDPYLLNLQNGTFNLNTCELQPHRSSDMLTMVAAANYDPNAECPRFLQFIDEVTLNRTEIKRYLQKACGYLLTGKNESHCMFFFYGKKTRNGKTTLASTIKGALGTYSVACDVDIITKPSGKGSGSPKPELLQLYKKRFAYFEEPDKYSTLQGSLLKQITGGSDLSARGLYSNSHLEFKCTAKMVISCNNLPRINDLSLIKSDRIKIIPFDKHFSEKERDTSLADQFATPEAMSFILNWLIEGYRLYVSEGLKPFREMKSLLDAYEQGYDIYSQFIKENLRLRKDNSSNLTDATLKAVWEVGKKWLKDNNYFVPTRRDFVYEIQKSGVELYRKNNQDYIRGFVLDGEGLYNTDYKAAADIQKKSSNDWRKLPRT